MQKDLVKFLKIFKMRGRDVMGDQSEIFCPTTQKSKFEKLYLTIKTKNTNDQKCKIKISKFDARSVKSSRIGPNAYIRPHPRSSVRIVVLIG